jgi:hypothetical protein
LTQTTYFVIRLNAPIPTRNFNQYVGLMVRNRFREIRQRWQGLIGDDDETRGD